MEKANEIQITYKNNGSSNQLKISNCRDANKIIMDSWDMDRIELYESFKVLFVNNGKIVKGIYTFSMGGLTVTMVDIRLIFATALKTLSTAIITPTTTPAGLLSQVRQIYNSLRKLLKQVIC